MTNYQKFLLQEFNKERVVNRLVEEVEVSNNNFHVQNKLYKNFNLELGEDTQEEIIKEEKDISETESNNIVTGLPKEAPTPDIKNKEVDNINLIDIKQQSYNNGFEAGKKSLEAEIANFINEKNIKNEILLKIESLNFNYDEYEKKIVGASINIIKIMLSKLAKRLPNDLSQLLQNQLTLLIKNNRIDSELIIKSNSSQHEMIKNFVSSFTLSEEVKKNIKIEIDDNLTTGMCQVFNKQAIFEFKEEQIIEEIDKIMKNVSLKN